MSVERLAVSKECPRCGGPASDHPCPLCEYAREIREAVDAEIERRKTQRGSIDAKTV